jgi:DNA-directed RNA polymerase beta subunit
MPEAIPAMLEKVDMVIKGTARVCASWMQVKREAMFESSDDKMS